MSEVKIKISGDSDDFKKSAEQAKKSLSGLNKEVVNFSDIAKGAFSSFIGNLSANAISGAFGVLKSGFSTAVNLAKEFSIEAQKDEDALNKLNFALASTGTFTKQSSQNLKDFSDQLQAASKFGGDQILVSASLIQTYGKLSEDGLKRATTAAADLATVLGIDLEVASKLVAKGANGNVEIFKKFGLEIERTGDKTKDFENALALIESKFGGAAKNSVNTFSGALFQANEASDGFKSTVGAIISQSPAIVGAINGYGSAFNILSQTVEENKDTIQSFIDSGIRLFIDGIGLAGDSIQFFIDLNSGFKAFVAEITDLFLAAGEGAIKFAGIIVDTSVSITDFFDSTTEAQRSAQESIKQSLGVFDLARQANKEKTLSDIASNEKLKEVVGSTTEKIQEEFNKRIEAAKASGVVEQSQIDAAAQKRAKEIALAAEQRQVTANEELLFKQQFNAEFLAQQTAFLGEVDALEQSNQIKKLAEEGKFSEALSKIRKQRNDAQDAFNKAEIALEQQKNAQKLAIAGSFANLITAIAKDGSKEAFLAQKAVAAAQIIIQGQTASIAALAPPPLGLGPVKGIPLASLVNAKTAISLGAVAAETIKGFNIGGVVTDGNIFGDSTLAALTKGEIVAPRKDFDDVVEGTARQRGFVKREETEAQSSSESISINIQGDIFGEETFIDRLAEKLLEAQRTRNLRLV
jgi:hypothetical protein